MFVTTDQLVCHAIGDYILQSDWMANGKTKRNFPAAIHAVTYSLPFLLLRPSLAAFTVILWSHFMIDRFRLARWICWAKNILGGAWPPYECTATGYPDDRPAWMAVWLLIIADNLAHVCINAACLKFL